MKYKAEIPDIDYWKRQIRCQDACPVHTDSRGYVRAIAEGDYERAYLIARGPNPLASICGRICGAPCEVACRRGSIDAPIAIRALKRFVTEQFGPEAQSPGASHFGYLREHQKQDECDGAEELVNLLDYLKKSGFAQPEGARVAIIGSGPAGLAAAHDLALLGFRPTIFEMEPVPAGLLYTGIPAYRLPRKVIEAEVAVIQALGVKIECGVKVGEHIRFAELRRDFAAVIIAVGCKLSRRLPIPGVDAEGVYGGVDFLRNVSLELKMPLGEKVIVIGGGNVAYDVSRTVLRQEQFDVSRTALRQPSVRQVHLCCLESREEMPADEIEVIEGEEEGVIRHNSLGPKEILVEETDGRKRVRGVRFRKVLSVFDENRRFAPKYDDRELTVIEADTVLLSVGQAADLSFVDAERDGVTLRGPMGFEYDPETLATTAPGVFVAGDVAYGTKLMIHAIASGKQAARSVYRYLTGKEIRPEDVQLHFPIERYRREVGYEKRHRQTIPVTAPRERLLDARTLVEKGYTRDLAGDEAGRCLDCAVNTIFDGEKCILCGGCVDVCPTVCLKIVDLPQVESSPELEELVGALRRAGQLDGEVSAILKDEERCIRCALCAQRCPTGAITMERFLFTEVWETCQPIAPAALPAVAAG